MMGAAVEEHQWTLAELVEHLVGAEELWLELSPWRSEANGARRRGESSSGTALSEKKEKEKVSDVAQRVVLLIGQEKGMGAHQPESISARRRRAW